MKRSPRPASPPRASACPRAASASPNARPPSTPLTSPGGWNLIGRCPLTLFSAERGSLLQPGDRVRFVSIDHAEFIRLGGDDTVMEASA